jgi:recombination protein RecA
MISRAGTYFNYGDVRLGQGRDNARQYLEEHPVIFEELDKKIRAEVRQEKQDKLNGTTNAVAAVAAASEED